MVSLYHQHEIHTHPRQYAKSQPLHQTKSSTSSPSQPKTSSHGNGSTITTMHGELVLIDTDILLITQNPSDFAGFPDIELFSPSSFLEAL
ncbi:MAG: hypothetical protein R6V86_03810 [Spirochaetia bacterium]